MIDQSRRRALSRHSLILVDAGDREATVDRPSERTVKPVAGQRRRPVVAISLPEIAALNAATFGSVNVMMSPEHVPIAVIVTSVEMIVVLRSVLYLEAVVVKLAVPHTGLKGAAATHCAPSPSHPEIGIVGSASNHTLNVTGDHGFPISSANIGIT